MADPPIPLVLFFLFITFAAKSVDSNGGAREAALVPPTYNERFEYDGRSGASEHKQSPIRQNDDAWGNEWRQESAGPSYDGQPASLPAGLGLPSISSGADASNSNPAQSGSSSAFAPEESDQSGADPFGPESGSSGSVARPVSSINANGGSSDYEEIPTGGSVAAEEEDGVYESRTVSGSSRPQSTSGGCSRANPVVPNHGCQVSFQTTFSANVLLSFNKVAGMIANDSIP
uniref:Uncharacterized protein n=1 Tax=Plectus sambesii TaxID=2011161 RepID=A0A914WKX7_9BILA